MDRARRIRLFNMLLAAIGGAVLTFSLVFAHAMGQGLLNVSQLILLVVVFWLINLCFISVVGYGLSERFKDPSLSKALMYWATLAIFVALTLVRNYHEMFYLSLFTVVIFGVFRLQVADFHRYTLFVIGAQITQSAVSYYFGSSNKSLIEILALLVVLIVSIATLAELCKSLTLLRQRSRNKNAELESALLAKDQFLANMSHELRTPMNGVLGMLQIVQNTELNNEQKRFLELAHASGNSMISLINDVLDFSKIKQNKIVLDERPFSLVLALQRLVGNFYYQAKQKGVEMILDLDAMLPERIIGDEFRILQIFNNLISNAIKFTPEGTIVISVKLQRDENRCLLQCAVTGTGIGIKHNALEKIFQQFTQADEGTTRDYGGSGLGLTIVRQLVNLMGGGVQVESQEDKGSRFVFNITLNAADESAPKIEHVLAQYQIDLVDDLSAHQKVMRAYFECLGAKVTSHQSSTLVISTLGGNGDKKTDKKAGSERNHLIVLHVINSSTPPPAFLSNLLRRIETLDSKLLILYAGEKPKALRAGFSDALNQRAICLEKPIDFTVLNDVAEKIKTNTLPHEGNDVSDKYEDACGFNSQPNVPIPAFNTEKNSETQSTHQADAISARNPVLIVEDNIINQQVARGMVTKLGLQSEVAINGAEALKMLRSEQRVFALILMDCQMPIMDGYAATLAIRNGDAGETNKRIPILAITASALAGDREKCISVGMNDYLAKPFQFEHLKTAIAKYLTVEIAAQ